MSRSRRGAALLAAALAVLACAGAPHRDCDALADDLARGAFRLGPASALRAVRVYLTDDDDLMRYLAYANAALGRPYFAWYVRRDPAAAAAPERAPDKSRLEHPSRPLLPYRDFLVEYPPGFLAIALPVAALAPDPDAFRLLFGLAMAACLWLALRCARRLLDDKDDDGALAKQAAAALLALGVVSLHRYDAVVALLIALAAIASIRDRSWVAGCALGAATAAKLTPLLIAPLLAIDWIARRRFRDLLRFSTSTLLTTLFFFAPFLFLAPKELGALFRYHALRPLQIESTAAAALALASHVFPSLSVSVTKTFGSMNLIGPIPDHIALYSSLLTSIALAFVYGSHAFRRTNSVDRGTELAEAIVATLVVFMTLGKVFSPQYLVWILPIACALSLGSTLRRTVLIALMLATQLVYPALYAPLARLSPLPLSLVLLRNGTLLVASLAPLIVRRRSSAPSTPSADCAPPATPTA